MNGLTGFAGPLCPLVLNDEHGLDGLLMFDGQRLRMVGKLGEGNNRMLLGGGAWQPLTVTERLGLQRQLARAEFLARTRTLRLNP